MAAIFTLIATSLFYSFQFFLRSSPNAMAEPLMRQFNLDPLHLGWLSAAYYIPYALLQIPIGILLDVFGPKAVLRVGVVLCVVGAGLFGWAPSFFWAMLARMLIGAGAAVSLIGSIRMNTLWFAPTYLAFTIGCLSALGKVGGSLANGMLPHILEKTHWQTIIQVACALGLGLALMIWIFVKNGPQDTFQSEMRSQGWAGIRLSFSQVIRRPTVWMMGLYGYSLYLTLTVFSDTYSIGFLRTHLGLSQIQAGTLASLVGLGSAVGSSLLTWISDHIQRRLPLVRLCAAATLCLSLILFFGPILPKALTAGVLLAFGFFSGGQILAFVIATESLPKPLAGMASGVINAMLMMGGMIHNPLMGGLLRWSHGPGAHPYTALDYRWALASLSLCFAGAVVVSLFLHESHPTRRPADAKASAA
jgi:sugar phosphate permease